MYLIRPSYERSEVEDLDLRKGIKRWCSWRLEQGGAPSDEEESNANGINILKLPSNSKLPIK